MPNLEQAPAAISKPPEPTGEPEERVPALLLSRVAPDEAAVEAGIEEALRLLGQSHGQAKRYSLLCASDLQRLPGDGLLDHCLAFDMTMARHQPKSGEHQAATRGHGISAVEVLEDPVLAGARVREIRRLVERSLVVR